MIRFGFHRPRYPKGALALFLVGVLPCFGGAAFSLKSTCEERGLPVGDVDPII